jgi:phosphotransacetylase
MEPAMPQPSPRTFDEIDTGDHAERTRTLRPAELDLFVRLSSDPLALWTIALIDGAAGDLLPGMRVLERSLQARGGIAVADVLVARVDVTGTDAGSRTLDLHCSCTNQAGQSVAEGHMRIAAPEHARAKDDMQADDTQAHEAGEHYRRLIAAAAAYEPIATAVVHPCDELSLTGALEAARAGLIRPVLIGPLTKIRRTAETSGCALDGVELIEAPHSHAAAAQAVALARAGKVQALMKGALHTDELMEAVVDSATGLRTERRMSHVFALDVPTYPKPLFITDAAINIAPTLADKRDIVQNAIELAHALGIALPNVAILSAVETVNPKIASTIDAAALCKMLDRGQITGARVDGPLAFDNAISRVAAKTKAINSAVAGDSDILVVPDLESGNMLVKQLVYLSDAIAAGIVLGARVPVMLTSRADDMPARLASAALALLFAHHREAVA